jgi:polysaccharide biosynthesis protein PslG
MRRLILLLLAVALLAAAPVAHAAALLGFNDDWHHANRTVAMTKRFHSNSDRLQVFWRDIEPAPGRFDWYGWDIAYNAMVARGVRPLLDVVTAPAWARDAACPDALKCMQAPAHDADFSAFVAAMARRYPQAAGVEISNEPNLHNWTLHPDPARYAQILKAGYVGVKSADPQLPVIIGATCCTTAHSNGNIGAATFLNRLYGYGIQGYYDAIGFHLYPGRSIHLVARDIRFELRRMRRVRNAHGDRSPFWVTEVGFPSVGVSHYGGGVFNEHNQAVRETIAYRVLSHVRDVAAIYFYRLTDPPRGGFGGLGMGLYHRNLTPKPAARALIRLIAGRR